MKSKSVLKYESADDCPCRHRHTKCPSGYIHWHEWAEKKTKNHRQIRCPRCGFFAIWVRKAGGE